MRRTLLALALMLFALGVTFALDSRLTAMGDIGVAVSGANMRTYVNPAAVFFDENSFTFAINAELSDTLGVEEYPYIPGSDVNAMFVADMVSISIGMRTYSENYRPATGNVDIFQETTLDVNFSAGYKFISVGVGVSGGSTRQRLDVPMGTIVDAVSQSLLAPYERVVNSEFIQVNLGMMFRYDQFFAGILFDNVLEKDGAATSFGFDSLINETGIGAYWSRAEYGTRGALNNLVYSVGAEIHNLFVNEKRSLNLGAELKVRLVRDSSISARVGYSGVFEDDAQRSVTAGIAVTLKKVELAVNSVFPIDGHSRLNACLTLLL